MSESPSADDERAVTSLSLRGLVAGLGAYLLGAGLVVGLVGAGVFGERGAWARLSTDISGHVLAHQAAHVPLWNGRIHPEMLPVTALLIAIVGGAGAVVARDGGTTRESAARTGGAVVVGYLPPTVLVSIALATAEPRIEPVTMTAPALLAGAAFPLVVGGAGGMLAMRLPEGEEGQQSG